MKKTTKKPEFDIENEYEKSRIDFFVICLQKKGKIKNLNPTEKSIVLDIFNAHLKNNEQNKGYLLNKIVDNVSSYERSKYPNWSEASIKTHIKEHENLKNMVQELQALNTFTIESLIKNENYSHNALHYQLNNTWHFDNTLIWLSDNFKNQSVEDYKKVLLHTYQSSLYMQTYDNEKKLPLAFYDSEKSGEYIEKLQLTVEEQKHILKTILENRVRDITQQSPQKYKTELSAYAYLQKEKPLQYQVVHELFQRENVYSVELNEKETLSQVLDSYGEYFKSFAQKDYGEVLLPQTIEHFVSIVLQKQYHLISDYIHNIEPSKIKNIPALVDETKEEQTKMCVMLSLISNEPEALLQQIKSKSATQDLVDIMTGQDKNYGNTKKIKDTKLTLSAIEKDLLLSPTMKDLGNALLDKIAKNNQKSSKSEKVKIAMEKEVLNMKLKIAQEASLTLKQEAAPIFKI